MNLHALQGYEAVAEAQELMSVAQQIVTPQSNSIIIGLVQDSLVGAYRLTAQDCFFTRSQAMNLMMAIHYGAPGRSAFDAGYSDPNDRTQCADLQLPVPAILKAPGGPRWTGKQLASLLLPRGLELVKSAKATLQDLTAGPNGVMVRDGEILAGRLSKSHLGAANTGLVHAIWRLYGPGGAHKFLSDAQRLFVKHLAHDGPTQSIVDCLVGSTNTREVVDILSKHLGRSDAVLTLDLPEAVKEAKSSSILQETLRAVGGSVLQAVRPESALANCVNSGSKGNVMNIAQIAGCVGQQIIYGRRVPLRQTRLGPRTLMCYAPGDMRAEARGFVANSYMSGLTPAEFFEHQMAGREGIVATAVNTSESGYNQRRMIKGQESQCVSYDGTVRVSTNVIIQTAYGGDDLDGSRLERVHLGWLMKPAAVLSDAVLALPEVQRSLAVCRRYAIWYANLYKELELSFPCAVTVGPVVAAKWPGLKVPSSAIAEAHKGALRVHARQHAATGALVNVSVAAFTLQLAALWGPSAGPSGPLQDLLALYSKAIVAAGEGVGALGASSIGEPSMQKTLNVFHYSGIADKNVTITGLPRFKQLINGVDTYETANMTADLVAFDRANEALQISAVMLSDVLAHVGPIVQGPASPGFALYGPLRGPFTAKLGPGGANSGANGSSTAYSVTMSLSWASLARKNITVDAVARALRETLGYDAIVVARPHWVPAPSGPSECAVVISFAPWLSRQAVEAICEGLVANQQVRGLDYIKNAIVFQETRFRPDTGEPTSSHVVETEGSNIVELAKCASVVPETVRTNNVYEACQALGIGIGLVVLQSELHKVLCFDGSYIDPRHTWLLADTMGRGGSLAAMNRHHMEVLGSSLLQKASFEQSLDAFEEGAAFGKSDPLAGATERIITGQPVCIGTGLVGIRPMDGHLGEAGEEIMVAPLALDSDVGGPDVGYYGSSDGGDRLAVRPLNWTVEAPLFDPASFAARLSDSDRVATDAFLELCATKFRAVAASKRLLPVLRLTVRLSESAYKGCMQACRAYSLWSTSTSSALVTQVKWPWPDKPETFYGLTTMEADRTHKAITSAVEVFASESSGKTSCDIFTLRPVEPLEVPFGVTPTAVIMRQHVVFSKGPFSLTLARQWTGHTNVEAEASLLKDKGLTIAILETADSEAVLQNRCSDAQLANALWTRLPR